MAENTSPSSESHLFKDQEVVTIPFNTDLLVNTYNESFTPTTFDDGSIFYTENSTSDNKARPYRYIASKSADKTNLDQNLFAVSSVAVWRESFAEEDYRRISEAGNALKFQIADEANKYLPNKKTVNLRNGSIVRVEYVPYSLKSSDRIIDDLGSKRTAE